MLQSNLYPQALQQWHVEKKKGSFFLLLLLELLQGLLTTWLQAQKHTWVHNPDVNLQTHVQGKQMYVGLHHLE
jgi:hypothetical protein